jgi:drug/metabolite transporter (DMT)-like permease
MTTFPYGVLFYRVETDSCLLVFGAVIGEALWTILGKAVSARVTPLTIASLTSCFGLLLFSLFAVYQASSFNFATVTPLGWAAEVHLATIASELGFVDQSHSPMCLNAWLA